MQGLTNGVYLDGSRFVFDLLDYVEEDKTIQEGSRKLVAVMHKNSEKFSTTGGWGFEGFSGDSQVTRVVTDGGSSCYACHTSMEESSYIFSKLRN